MIGYGHQFLDACKLELKWREPSIRSALTTSKLKKTRGSRALSAVRRGRSRLQSPPRDRKFSFVTTGAFIIYFQFSVIKPAIVLERYGPEVSIMLHLLCTSFLAVLVSAPLSAPADPAFSDGNFDTAFGSFGGWVTTGTVSTRAISDIINGTIDPADQSVTFDIALNDYFTTGFFAVLGNVFFNTNGAPDTGTHTLSRSFTLAPGSTYDVAIGFRTVLDGRSPNPDDSYCDFFSARLLGPRGFNSTLFSRIFCNGDGQFNNMAFSVAFQQLAAGQYSLVFTLVEGPEFDTLNTAAGVDNVLVDVTTHAVSTSTKVPIPV